MATSDSENDDFLSADEFESDDDSASYDDGLTKNKQIDNSCVAAQQNTHPAIKDQSEEKLVDNVKVSTCEDNTPIENSGGIAEDDINDTTREVSYRKRPQRQIKDIGLSTKSDFKPIIDIVKVTRPDAIINDIKSQLSFNITKGIATFQETSSSLKGLVLGNFTKENVDEGVQFSYDDDRLRDIRRKSEVVSPTKTEAVENELQGRSAISDEILKLSNAFAKLNESRNQAESDQSNCQRTEKQPESSFNTGTLSSSDSNEEEITPNLDDSGIILPEFKSSGSAPDKSSNGNQKQEVLCDKERNDQSEEAITSSSIIVSANTDTSAKFCDDPELFSTKKDESQLEAFETENIKCNTTNLDTVDSKILAREASTTSETYKNQSHDDEELTINQKTSEDVKDQPHVDEQLKIDALIKKEAVSAEPQDKSMLKENENPNFSAEHSQLVEIQEHSVDGWDDWKDSDDDCDDGSKGTEQQAEVEVVTSKEEISEETCNDGWDVWEDDEDGTPGTTEKKENTVCVASEESIDDGWGDWGDNDDDTIVVEQAKPVDEKKDVVPERRAVGSSALRASQASQQQEWKGWDSFGQKKDKDWGIGGWGINTLLSTATAVTHGLSNVIESGLGVPDPETMARMKIDEEKSRKDEEVIVKPQIKELESSAETTTQFPFRHIVAGVGKIVEVTKVQEIGSRVLSGGLDTLETIGKKTMAVLQEGDPGLKKKRALLVGQGQILSQVLKEARDIAIAEDKKAGELAACRRFRFETLFDDFQGLVHLEALEMLSRQCELRLEQIQQNLPPAKLNDLKDTLEEVNELCEVDEDFDNVEIDDFKKAITDLAHPLRNELSVAKILEVHGQLTKWLAEGTNEANAAQIYDEAISTIAKLTAAVTMQFHKSGELLILKERRKTVEEADCLIQLTSHLCSELKSITENVAKILGNRSEPEAEILVTNMRVESENAIAYIKQAFRLLIPVLQLGAT